MSRVGDQPIDVSFDIALEFVVECLHQQLTPYDIFSLLGIASPMRPSWNDLIWRLAELNETFVRKMPYLNVPSNQKITVASVLLRRKLAA